MRLPSGEIAGMYSERVAGSTSAPPMPSPSALAPGVNCISCASSVSFCHTSTGAWRATDGKVAAVWPSATGVPLATSTRYSACMPSCADEITRCALSGYQA